MGYINLLDPVWHDAERDPPKKAGKYLTAFHPGYRDNDVILVDTDSFRGGKNPTRKSWAHHRYRYVIAWMELPTYYKEQGNEQNYNTRRSMQNA